jgi:nicotinate dehydrogenase subunit B
MSVLRQELPRNSAVDVVIEPERYELHSAPAHHFEIDRRDFVKVFGAGIAVFLVAKEAVAQQGESGGTQRGFGGQQMPKDIAAWLHIDESGAITVYTGKVEIGQNIRTSLAQVVAEELRAPFDSIRMVMGDTKLTPYDAGTFGSQTTPRMGMQLRRVASSACDILVDLAAKQWNADRSRLVAKNAKVTDPSSGRSATYAQLAQGQALAQTIPDTDPLIPPAEWTVAGKAMPKVDGSDFVTGRHKYTSDMKLPGMLYGKVLRPASYRATVASADLSAAQAMPGVVAVRDADFVGAAAPDVQTAQKAIDAMRVQWNEIAGQPSNRELVEFLKANVATGNGGGRGEGGGRGGANAAGSIEEGLASAQHKLDATYTVAYIQHAPLEPRAAVARWDGNNLEVWTGTQRPFGVRDELQNVFHLPEGTVRVQMPDMGSGYGGKHTGECAVEAARLAKAAGKPVKLVWTREEEFTWAYFRPAGVIEIHSGVGADGVLTAWEFHNYNSGGSGIGTPYAVANKHEQFHPEKDPNFPLRQGSYRALAATANHFARESHMDDLARELKMDPLEFRLKNLRDDRLIAVLKAATDKFGWASHKASADRGFGVACGVEKGGYIATCAEVAVDRASGAVRIVRVVTAFECGAIVNPDGLRNQIAGSNVMGLGGALFEAIQFENGRVTNGKFSKYRVPRFKDAPQLEVVLVDRKDIPPAGAGETPLMALAPAIGNAIFEATGTRLRALPMAPNGLKTS